MSTPVVTLTLQDDSKRKVTVERGGHAGIAAGACPACKFEPFSVVGHGMTIESHDTYRADASCRACGARVGVLRAVVDTIFGLEEDERVLCGPYKVY